MSSNPCKYMAYRLYTPEFMARKREWRELILAVVFVLLGNTLTQ